MKEISLNKYVKKYIEDDYAMSVLYYNAKKAFIEHDFTLSGFSYFFIDGRFLGESLKVLCKGNYRSTIHSLGFLLSIRLLMIDKEYMDLCEDENLIFVSKPRESFQWINYMTLIMDNWKDEEVKMIFLMMEYYYYEKELEEESKVKYRDSLVVPEYRNERKYYQYLAYKTNGVSEYVVGNNAFLESDIESYTVSENINYVGNTAFAYCSNLVTLEFEGKAMFGIFPIVECANLRRIIVPGGLKDYYKENLPYYSNIIVEKNADANETVDDDIDIEIVHVDHPSAEPYTDVEISSNVAFPVAVQEEEREPIDFKILQKVFDKKATSYKYFWMLAIISLAKESKQLSISFNDLIIRMAALAWPVVFEYDIDLGSNDMIKSYMEQVVKKTSLIKAASSNVVEKYLLKHYSSQGVDKVLAPLMKNVPYRFLSPWIKYTTDEEVIEKSCSRNFNGPYAIHSKYIVLDEEWWEYIEENYQEVYDFVKKSFIAYAKKYNNDMKLVKLMTNGWQLIK